MKWIIIAAGVVALGLSTNWDMAYGFVLGALTGLVREVRKAK